MNWQQSLGFQGNNLTLQKLNETAVSLGLPSNQSFINRRIARAYDLVNTGKVTEVTDGIFRVWSQYEPNKIYIVNLNHGEPSCDCPDGERTINCKHRIADLLYAQKQAKPVMTIIKNTDGDNGDHWRRCWMIAEGNARITVYHEPDGRLFCNCKAHYGDCEHKQLVIRTVTKEMKEKLIHTECGSNEALELQNKLNGQLDSQGNNGNGAEKHALSLDLSDPFQECEQLSLDQIEGRSNGELVHKLRNGEYVISYRGIMTLAEKHGIKFDEVSLNDDNHTVIVNARRNKNESVSGKPVNGGLTETAIELAKRNAARQLLPLPEIKAMEKKAQLYAEFNWQVAYEKCAKIAGGKPQVDILISDLVNAGKLRQAKPSEYDRTEWLLIYEYCKKDASQARDPKSLNNWSYNSAVFMERCREAIEKVRAEKKVEANELPPMKTDGKRKVQMDKKLNTFILEADGTKKAISCREIAEKYDSYEKGIIKRLRRGIDSGADISTVELDD